MINTCVLPIYSIPLLTLFPVKSEISFLPTLVCVTLHGDRSCQQIRPYLLKVTLICFCFPGIIWNCVLYLFIRHTCCPLAQSGACLWLFCSLPPTSKPLLVILLQRLYYQEICFYTHVCVCVWVCLSLIFCICARIVAQGIEAVLSVIRKDS